MIVKKRILLLASCLLTAVAVVSSAAPSDTPPSAANGSGSPVFKRARDFYAADQVDSVIAVIREHLRKNGRDPESYTLVPLVIEAYLRKKEHPQVHRLIDMYRQKFPESSFLPRLAYLEGVTNAREARPVQALTSFSTALSLGVSVDLLNLTISNAELVCGRSLSSEELSNISGRAELHPVLLEIVRFHEIQKLIESGQVVRAKNSAEEFRETYPRSRYTEPVKVFLSQFVKEQQQKQRKGPPPLQVGLLAPMTGEDADIGKFILQGVKLALDGHNQRAESPIKLIVYDTKGSPVETARKSKDLLVKDQAQLCIGPILSNTAVVSAAMFSDRDIVMITPTANEDGISAIGENIFQMNVTLGTMAQRLAKYAIENMSIRDFAIIAPSNGFGFAMADAFKDELRRQNIEVAYEEYFAEGTHDFSGTLNRLRGALIRRRLEEVLAERGLMQRVTSLSVSDSMRYADTTLAVGGLFMPLSDYEDVLKLSSQVVFRRIRTQMLGTGGWSDPRVPSGNEGKRYANNAIVSVGIQPDMASDGWQTFASAYKNRYNDEPNRIAAMGYDAAMLVIKATADAGGFDIAKLRKALAAVKEYSGLSGLITFDPVTGANGEAIIMKVTDKGFVRVH
ncbi:MAG: penicillin-binding protein activator [Chitinispirillales bacterium]|nr:penicillin-binding protein activator [Chitinispirillales bacterium]